MKCPKCGSELENGVLFCRECGEKVMSSPKEKCYCRECGAKISSKAKFCSECGAKVIDIETVLANFPTHEMPAETEQAQGSKNTRESRSAAKQPSKNPRISSDVKVSKSHKKIKAFTIVGMLISIFIIICIFSSNSHTTSLQRKSSLQAKPSATIMTNSASKTNYTIEKRRQYTVMTNDRYVYVATEVSNSIIKIESWKKSIAPPKTFSFSSDMGSFRINDPKNGFFWIDDSHMAFSFIFQDPSNLYACNLEPRVFTININESVTDKGTNYDQSIRCYSYANDDRHIYRAIPLTGSLIKIECWAKPFSTEEYYFNRDWCVIDLNNTDTDFEWTDAEQTSFVITTQDPENTYFWTEPTLVVFELENPEFKYASVSEYLGFENSPSITHPSTDEDSMFEATPSEEQTPMPTQAPEFTPVSTPSPTSEPRPVPTPSPTSEPTPIPTPSPTSTPTTVPTSSPSPSPSPSPTSIPTSKPSVSYSTNDRNTAKKGNSGVFSYRNMGGLYYIYYIIDFDEGYVYYFCDGDGSTTCDRVKMVSGDLNSVLIITYHDGEDTWSYGLHFKWKNQPDHLVVQDEDGFDWDYYTTNLKDALALRDKKTIYNY